VLSGRQMRAVPLVAIGLILVCVPVWRAASQGNAEHQYGPNLLPLVPPSMGPLSNHTYIGHTLPPLPRSVGTAQGGPWPDSNLTPNTLATSEVEPAAAPGLTMNRVAFSTTGVDADGDFRIDPSLPADPGFVPNYNIWTMRPDGSEARQVTNLPGDEREPAWDPGSRWIAFSYRAKPEGNWDIYLINLNTLAVQQLTFGAGNKRHPTFSMDGNWVAFQWDINGNWDIYKTPTSRWEPVQLTTSPTDDTDPAWCPAANLIAYTGTAGAGKRIFVMDQDGGNQTVLSNGGMGGRGNDVEPAWLWIETAAASNIDIVFASDRLTSGADPHRDYNIFRMTEQGEIDGPEAVLLTNKDEATDEADDRNPAVSPELQRASMRVFFESTRDDPTRRTWDIWTFFVTDRRPPELVELPWVSQRELAPGSTVKIYARVRDWDTGVRSVVAVLKNAEPLDPVRGGPNSANWLVNWTYHDGDFDATTGGVRFLEYDCPEVARIPLDPEPGSGSTIGEGAVFSGEYDTELVGHDYIIDIEVVDEVGNSLRYDDVYGFTTRAFQPKTNVLFVNDYCEGQSFLYKLGYNNDYAAAYPVESYYLYNPSGLDPNGTNPWGGVRFDTIRGYYQERYDVWRIICRGPIPPWVYQYYLPTVEYQLDPQEALSDPDNAQPTRRVLVADRAIVWACPHAGDLWVARGGLIDAATQADLALFLERGGRLFISGEDIAWALTMNGTTPNDFLRQYLRADFVRDTPVLVGTYPRLGYPDLNEPIIGNQPQWWRLPREIGYTFTARSRDNDPVADDPWAGSGPISIEHEQYLGVAQQPDHPVSLVTPRLDPSGPDYTDAAEFSFRPDIIQEQAGAVKLYALGDNYDQGPTIGLRYEDLNTGAKVIYLAFGFEQIHRRWSAGICYNHRANLMHNALCWMRTSGFQGRVLGVDGKPVLSPTPIVYCYRQRAGQPRELVAAVRCQNDGTYVMQGLGPDFYTLEATRPGYTIDKYDGEFVHGGLGFRIVDFVIKQREPGSISGIVTAEATGQAIQGVKVCVSPYVPEEDEGEPTQPPPGEWPRCTVTGFDGSYTISELPAGDYEITVDGSEVGYGVVGPDVVTVNAGGTTRADFALPAADGRIVATVLARDEEGNVKGPLAGATVDVLSAGRKITSGVTDTQGVARIAVQPGQYTVVGDAPGYGRSAPQPVAVRSQEDTAVTILMDPQPPGSVLGRIVSGVSGQPVGGVEIRLLVGGVQYASVVSTGELQRDTPDGPLYNFKFTQAPAGTVVVRPIAEGYASEPRELSVIVVSGEETSGLLFRLTSLHTFPAGLQLISLPGDYRGVDPRSIFGLAATQRLRLAAWEATRNQYSVYPHAPADVIRPGWGYWLLLDAPTELTREGLPAQSPTEIAVYGRGDGRPTWNLIGAPFTRAIDVYSIRVRDANGNESDWQTAQSRRKILSVLYAYVLGAYQPSQTLSPYLGYWVAVNEPLTLITRDVGLAQRPESAATAFPALGDGGWAIQLTVRAGEQTDACLYLGVRPDATEGFDPGIDQPKPPQPAVAPYVYASAVHEDWGRLNGSYAVDMRPSANNQVYRVMVDTNMAGEEVSVSWPDLSGVPANVKPVLYDPGAGKRVYMRTCNGYSFVSRGPRELQVELRSRGASALVVSALQAIGHGRQVDIQYTLSQQARVRAEIMNMAGRVVRVLTHDQLQQAGRSRVVWDCRNHSGTPVPAGRYLVVVRAYSEEGECTQAVGTLSVGR
jgi:hypothetical protein